MKLENGPNVDLGGRTLQTVCHVEIISPCVMDYVIGVGFMQKSGLDYEILIKIGFSYPAKVGVKRLRIRGYVGRNVFRVTLQRNARNADFQVVTDGFVGRVIP